MNFVLGFDVAMLGYTDINAHSGSVGVFPINAAGLYGFIGTVDAHTASPRTPASILAALMTLDVEIADAGNGLAKIANFILPHPTTARQKPFAEFVQAVAVR